MVLMTILSALLAHQVVTLSSSTPCGFRYVENPEIQGVCCNPYFDCDPGYQIIRCTKSFGNDTCEQCPEGYVQPDVISSFDPPENTKCFKKTSDCWPRDSTYSRKNENGCAGKNGCKCATSECYYDESCVCNSIYPCGVNEELDPVKKECVPCREFRYKDTRGCTPCRMNRTAWEKAMDNKSADLTTPYKGTTTSRSSSSNNVDSSSSTASGVSNSRGSSTGLYVTINTNSTVSDGPVLEIDHNKGTNLQIILGILIPFMLVTIISVILYVKYRNNPQECKLVCLNLLQRRNERRDVPVVNGHVVRYDPILQPEFERNGNLNKSSNNDRDSCLTKFPPIDSVPNQPDSVKQSPQCNNYAVEQNSSCPQTNHVVSDQSSCETPPQSILFETDRIEYTPLVQHSNPPLRVKIAPQTSKVDNLETPTPTKSSLSDDFSAKIATPTDHDSRSEMVPSASPFQMNTNNHPLSGATYDGTRIKELAAVPSVSPTESKVNVVKPFVKYDSGCFSTATERLSSAAQSNNFQFRRPQDEGENDTEVKRQPNSHESKDEDNNHESS